VVTKISKKRHLCPEMRAMAKMASLWRFELDAKRGPLETGDFDETGNFGEKRQRAGHNGDKCPHPLETGDFGEIANFGENRQRVSDIQNVANIQIGCQK